ncbi:hypothetical protein [Nocardia sp. XZ_19_385]|uniref:hypothetical protein n=1 Tax=Nocardia sp. XZ_19_385 TaxID=2769488 RepID=UPI00188F40D1|nr:hypothetical protein [Nocardia sp. XZ_19_385]
MASTATKLLKEIEALSVPARRRAVATCALRLRGTGELTGLLAELTERGHYEQVLAIHLAVVAGEREFLLRRLDSESPELAARAVNALVRSEVELEALIDRLPRMSHRTRRAMYRALARAKGSYVADPLLPEIRRLYGDGEAARILPYCSDLTVAKYLPELAYAVPDWPALGRRHIGIVLDYAEELATAATESEWQELWSRVGACARTAAEHQPGRLLALAARAIRHTTVHQLQPIGGRLARHDLDAVVALVLHPSGHGAGLFGKALWLALRELPDERLIALCAVYPHYHRASFLRALAPSRRTAVVRAVFARPGVDPAAFDSTLLDLLPRQERAELARELLGRPGGSEVQAVRDRLTARLPWDEAQPVLAEAIRRPTADERAYAYPLLITSAFGTRDPAVLGALLELLRRLRNEQDPVRAQALQALAAVPPTLLRIEHLPALEQLCGDALQARDRSYGTTATVGALARLLLVRAVGPAGDQAFADTALRSMELLAAHTVRLPLSGLHENLPRGAEQRLFEALRRRLDNDTARDDWVLTLDLASGLDKRAWNVADLQRLVLRACEASDDAVVRRAVDLTLRNPATRDDRLTALLKRDRSLITLPPVQRLIGARRTDLLESLLGAATPGRFLSSKVRFVPTFSGGFGAWTAHQVEQYARLLSAHADHRKSSMWEKAWAVRRLGRLPDSFERLAGYVEHPELTVSEAALTALGRSAQPERALPLLAGHVDSDRARVAVSSISTCAKGIAPDRLAVAAAPLLNSRKITANKEGARLLAELHAPEAMAALQEIWQRPGQHRDVRRAVVFACRFLLDRAVAWEVLTEAATDPGVAGEILNFAPRLLPIEQRRRMASLILEMARSTDTQLASLAIAALPQWSRWSPPETTDELVRRVCDLSELGVWRASGQTLVSLATVTDDPSALLTAVRQLLAASDFTLPGRDLPARQRLSALVSQLSGAAQWSAAGRNAAVAVAAELGAEPLWRQSGIDLYLAGIRWDEPESTIESLRRAGALADGVLVCHPARQLERALLPGTLRTTAAATMLDIAQALADSSDLATAYSAVSLISMCGKHFGWSPTWTELLLRMRAHNKIDIRAAASAEFMVAE